MTPEQDEIALDIFQFTLDIAGIFDPTPVSDGTNALISIARHQWLNAAISGVAIVPYLGDLAKLGKLPHYAETVTKAIKIAGEDERFEAHLRPALLKLKEALEKVPLHALPSKARLETQGIIHEINAFLRTSSKAEKGFKPFADFPRFEGRSIKEVQHWLMKNGFHQVQAPTVTAIGKTKQSQIWFRRTLRPDGTHFIEAVRIDARGHKVGAGVPRHVMEPHRFPTKKIAAGEQRHMHKELIDSTMESAYKGGGIKKNNKHWSPPSFDDLNRPATGDHLATHIRLTP